MDLKKKTFILIFLFTGVIFLVIGLLVHKEFKSLRENLIGENCQMVFDKFISIEQMLIFTIFILFLVLIVFIYNHLKSKIFNHIDEINERISKFESIAVNLDSSQKVFENISTVFDHLENLINNLEKEREDKKTVVNKLNEVIEETQKESEHIHRLASVGTIASGITHEIGNPLGAISGYANTLSDPSILKEDIANYCMEIQTEIKKIEGIIRKVSSFAKSKDESEEIVDLQSLVDESIVLCSYHKNFKKVEIIKDLDKESVFIQARKNQLLQVFINILTNAIDAMGKSGEVKITFNKLKGIPHQLIHLFPKPSNEEFEKYDMIDIMFKDSGKGIDESDFAKVFSPFFTKGKAEKGTGLGLHISYQIIRSLGGAIFAEKGINNIGTIIHVQIPLKDKELTDKSDDSR
jgi:two-component system, NtrC family, sensor kinase